MKSVRKMNFGAAWRRSSIPLHASPFSKTVKNLLRVCVCHNLVRRRICGFRCFCVGRQAPAMSWRGKLSQVVQELRIHCCQYSPASTVTRSFIQRNYADLKALNPTLPILIRECSGVQPRIWARYDNGVERSVELDGLTEPQIDAMLEMIVKQGN